VSEQYEIDGDTIELREGDPTDWALWYKQLASFDRDKRKQVLKTALARIKAGRPDTYEFIQKFKCELVGICPNISYTLCEGPELDVTFFHNFSMPTLLFWCDAGKFGFFVNANLEYNDTVLNNVSGNKRDREIKGFTG
jgi:hypothetical protein